MLTCPKCGYDNELGRIFCHQCGQKLDINQIKPPSRGGKSLRKKRALDLGQILRWTVRLILLGALVWIIYSIAQVPPLKALETTDADLVSFYKKRDALENAIALKRAVNLTFTQAEVNKFLDTLKLEKPEGKGLVMSVTDLQVELERDEATAIILGKVGIGTTWEKQLYIRYTGTPGVADGRFVFTPVTARIGTLKVPRFVLERTGLVQGWYRQLFGQLEEKRLLEAASKVQSDTQALLISYAPPTP
jgi:hypothetical protein